MLGVTNLNFPSISTVSILLSVYVTSSHIRTFRTRVQLHVLKEGFREACGTHHLVRFCHMFQVTVLRSNPQRCLRNSCCRPMQFRSSCRFATTIVLPVLCFRSVNLRKYLNLVQNYIQAAFSGIWPRNIPTVRSAYVLPVTPSSFVSNPYKNISRFS
jgi:hypothetical protein